MPSRQWLHAWTSIRLSDKEGHAALKQMLTFTGYGVDGPLELVVGTMTGDGDATLMSQAVMILWPASTQTRNAQASLDIPCVLVQQAYYGRTACVDFLLENGCRDNLKAQSATGLNASE